MDLPDQQQLDTDDSHDGVASVHDEGSENNDGDVEVVITIPPSNHSNHHSESSVVEIPEGEYDLSTSMKSARTVVTPEADVSEFAPESYITSSNDTPMSAHRSVKGGTSSTKDGEGTLITGGSTKLPGVTAASNRAPLPSIAMRSSDVASRTSGAAGAQIDSHDFRMMAKHAMTLSQHNRLGAGAKSAYQADMNDIGALGIGLQLYFMLTKYLGFAFLIMGLMSLPAIIVNLHGHGITDKTVDPLQLAYASLGNEGVSEEIVGDPKLCLPKGDIDCTWGTVTTPFTSSPVRVSWIITFSDCVYSVFFLFFYLFYRYKAKQAIDVHLNENLTPAKYAVKVRGLPPDATEEEILRHFNDLYDLTKDEQYFPLWFGCCWARRRRVKHSQSKRAINRSVVKNLDHLAGTTSITKNLYLNTWIAEVSIAHPTGGLLRTFLSMEKLTESIARKTSLIATLQDKKSQSPSTFKPRDEKLLHTSYKKLEKFTARLEKAKSSIKELKRAASQSRQSLSSEALNNGHTTANNNKQLARAKVSAAAKAARTAATNTQQAFNWDACECAFVVFNNLESRRRCLQDYRRSTFRLACKFQPKLLRFRNGTYPLIVTPAPEPSNILWENLEVTDRGRFYRRDLQEAGKKCETYLASHVLYCYCSDALAASITKFGFVEGPKALWRDYLPCRGYIKDFLTKNGFVMMAAAVVIIVNTLLEVMLRGFASFERHDSESSKASGIAVKLFLAQFLNTAIVVLLVNASLGLKGVPVLKELLKGSYVDFERNWYPTVGMGITTTMIINAFLPQAELFVRMFIILPVKRELKRRKIRTQDDMNKLYAGPAFDISSRYPMLLNSVFVTMVFCGGSPTLLFVAAFAATGTYWFDKLSITHLYSVKTTYDEELGKIALSFLPWTLVLHLGFSTWMYGNPDLMKSHLLDMEMVLKLLGLRSILNENPGATNEQLYDRFVEEASKIDLLGQHGVVVKILRSNVMLIFLFFVGVILCILFSTIWIQVLWPLIRKMAQTTYRATCWSLFVRASPDMTLTQDDVEAGDYRRQHESRTKAKKPVVIPEFADLFRKSVGRKFRPDTKLGFERNEDGDLIRKWHETTTLDGIKRIKGQPMRTWEAMQAPNKTYAIEMNERYKLAVAEIVAAAKQLRVASMKLGVVAPIVDKEDVNPEMIEAAIAATDAVTIVNDSSS
uniref:CSC1/OSCA1-like cytosolic domain-containing protein n=1 Tax=Globisporangium ultimum (strain ATCC 200006 / CBS 805.95 / DAOM BR144) TaxID=431595 RepID=K3X976_GLOUD